MKLHKILLMSLLTLVLAAPAARADWFVSPLVGVNFGGDTNNDSRKPPVGLSLGYMGAGVIGFETTFVYTPSFFNDSDIIGDNNVMSWMGNIIVGVPIGIEQQVRPYASGGVGILRSRIGGDADDIFDISRNDFGVNVGAGVMGFFTPNVGLRGDVRYFRSVSEDSGDDFDLDLGDFDFWQFTAGVAFRF
ncbi:MAG TPA: outer membrane beta-barrel protein [Vicinamibacterales bacterium]|nr:outer membrane beta-barrel protein [Vicinamibacterales bacterium]